MHKYLFNYLTIIDFDAPVYSHSIKLKCIPFSIGTQTVESYSLIIDSNWKILPSIDVFGNQDAFGYLQESHHSLSYVSSGIILTDNYKFPADRLPLNLYFQSTFLTEIPPSLKSLKFNGASLVDRAGEISHWIYTQMCYAHGYTNSETTAAQFFELKKGVCQDFSHLMIAICRENGICSRYVAGLILGIGQTHAWVEVWDGHFWIGFDPTNDCRIYDGYLKLCVGRNAREASVSNGVYMGNSNQKTTVNVFVKEL